MECRLQHLMDERNYKASDIATNLGGTVLTTVMSVLRCGIGTLSIAVKYARALRVPLWEMFFTCEYSAVGVEFQNGVIFHQIQKMKCSQHAYKS